MKKIITYLGVAFTAVFSSAQNDVNFSASQNWIGYMNVFNLPADGGGYQFGSGWGVSDLKTVINTSSNNLTLHPNFNTYADNPTDPFWVNQTTGEGNKYMEAITYVEPGSTFNGQDLTFHGEVVSNTIDLAQYQVVVFIKALDPNNGYQDALGGLRKSQLPASGAFTISATAAELAAGLIIQYGFIVSGRNGNPAQEAALGKIIIGREYLTIEVDFDAADTWIGYMNVFNLPADGGAYQFGSPWALADMPSTLTSNAISNTLELQPNFSTYAANPTDPFWVNQTTGEGNKYMEASTYVEPGSSFNGSNVVFKGDIYKYTISNDYDVDIFIKALDPNNGYADALGGTATMAMPTSGTFEVSAPGSSLAPGLIIQYGFVVKGRNANPLQSQQLGSAIVGTSSLGIKELNAVEARVFPNPAKDQIQISSASEIESYDLMDPSGKVLFSGSNSVIGISELPIGLYMVRVNTANGSSTVKFLKQ